MASPKYRDYFVTVNEGAKSFDKALDITRELNAVLFAYIIHDKDVILDDGKETPKKTHIHIVTELKNPITFKSMQNKYEGAHVEVIKYKKTAYQYLIHNRPNAKDKYQYAITEIISNNISAVKEAINAEEGLRLFNEREFLRYIAEEITTPYQFTKAFGLNVYKQYWKAYQDMLENLKFDPIMRRDLEDVKRELQEELDKELPF